MFLVAQGQGLQCSACGNAVSSQSVQRCKNCNEGYCEHCFKKRNELDETKAEKTEGECIPCANTILIVKIQIEDKKNSLPSRNTSSQSEQSQSLGGAVKQPTVFSAYSWPDSYEEENEDDYNDYDFDTYSQQTRGKQWTVSKKKDRACPIYRDKNGNRVPFALILAGVVSEYDRDPPLTGKSTGLKGSTKLSSGFSVSKNKNAGMKKNAQLIEEKGSKNQFVPDGKGQRLKESGEGDSSGQSNELLEVCNANMPYTAVTATYNDPINKPLADVQKAKIQQRKKSGKGHSVNVQDFYHSSLDHQEAFGSQHRPPVAMILAGHAGEKYLQEALHSRMKFMGSASQQFSTVSRFQEHSTGRDNIVASRQKSQNKNLVLTRSSSLVKDSLTENSGQNFTESGALNGTTMPTATEDTKQSQSSCTIADIKKQSLTLKLQGSFAKEAVKRKVSEEDTEDQKRAITGDVVTNSVLSIANRQSTKKTYEKQEKLRTSKQDSETSETKVLESSHVLVERSMDNVNEGMKQDNFKKTKNLEYDKDKAEPKQSVKTSFVATSDSKDTSQIRSVGSVPAKTLESFTSEESDSDDGFIPYALRMADISREPHRKKKKEKLGSDKPFALQLPTVNKNPPEEGYTLFRVSYISMKQDNEKDTLPNFSAKSDNIEGSDSEFCIVISQRSSGPTLTELDTVENDLKSAKGGKNGSSGKPGHKNIINKNMNQASSIKIAILDTEPVHKMDDTPTQNVQGSRLEESKKSRNSHVESEQEKLMDEDEGTKEKPKSETDTSVKPGNDNTINGNMEVMVLNPANKGPSETEAETPNDDSEAASTLVNFDASISERNSDKEDSLEEIDKSDNETIANSENNPQMETVTRKEENNSVDENGTVTLLASAINDKLKNPQPDVQFETSSAVGISDEANPSVMDRYQSTTSLEEDVKQTSKRAKIETSTQDVNNKKEEVDGSMSQFHIESVTPSQPSGTMKNSYLWQSSGDKEKEGHSGKNATKQEVKTSAKNQQSKTNEMCDPSNVCDIDHTEIHHAFRNIGRKSAHRSTLCCMGCGRPECQSNVMQNMLLMNQVAKKNGLQVCDVNPDGNCMFTAVVDQLLSQADHRFDAWSLRQNAVSWLRNNPCSKDGTHYSSFLDSESWEEYLLRLSQETQWGDHIILRAIAEFLKLTIEVLTPQKSSETFHVTKIEPEFNKPSQDEKSLLLGHVGESHYVSLRPKDPTVIEPKENEKPHEIEELEKMVIDIEKQKDEGENTQHVSPDCREKVEIFEESYIDTWSDCPGIHLSFALKKTFSPATVLQEANSVSSEMVSCESDMQSYYSGNTFHQGKYVKIYVGSVIEGLYCPDLDKPNECGLSYDWGEITEIFVRQDLQVIQKNDLSEIMSNLYMEEDPAHPGFVRLLSASLSIQQAYGADIPGSPIKYISNNSFKSPKHSSYFPFSVKCNKINVRDVAGIRCLYWPTSAEKWASRKRFEGWPPESIIHDIVNEGCLILPVPNTKSQFPEVVFQISFALAEKKLAQIAVSNEQRYCYIIWKAICNQVFKGKNLLEAIYYKTVFFFACETVPAEHWRNHPGPCIFFMLDELLKCIRERNLPNYFLPRNNLLDATDAEKLKDAEEILRNLRSNILLYVRLLMETTWKQTNILEKVIDNIQTFKIFRSARMTTLELFVPEAIELAKESVRSYNYKEGYEHLTQAYEDRLAVCTCDDQMPINLFIHGAISNVGITATTWFLLYCDEHFKGQLASSLMQEMSLYDGHELITIGHILPADISGKYVDAQVPKEIARDVCSFSCQFAKYLNHIGSSNHALQVLYYCIHRHKEQEEKASQSVLTGEENKQANGKEHNDLGNDFSNYNMLDVYITLQKVYSSRSEIQLLRQHLTDIVQIVEKIGNSSAYHSLSYMLGELGDKEGKEEAYIKYQELQQVEAEVRKEIEASEKSYKLIIGMTIR